MRHSLKIFSLQVPDGAVRAGRGAAEAEPDHGLSGGAAAAVREEQGRGGAEQAAKQGHRSWAQLSLLTLTSCSSCDTTQLCETWQLGAAHLRDTNQLKRILIINSRGDTEKKTGEDPFIQRQDCRGYSV